MPRAKKSLQSTCDLPSKRFGFYRLLDSALPIRFRSTGNRKCDRFPASGDDGQKRRKQFQNPHKRIRNNPPNELTESRQLRGFDREAFSIGFPLSEHEGFPFGIREDFSQCFKGVSFMPFLASVESGNPILAGFNRISGCKHSTQIRIDQKGFCFAVENLNTGKTCKDCSPSDFRGDFPNVRRDLLLAGSLADFRLRFRPLSFCDEFTTFVKFAVRANLTALFCSRLLSHAKEILTLFDNVKTILRLFSGTKKTAHGFPWRVIGWGYLVGISKSQFLAQKRSVPANHSFFYQSRDAGYNFIFGSEAVENFADGFERLAWCVVVHVADTLGWLTLAFQAFSKLFSGTKKPACVGKQGGGRVLAFAFSNPFQDCVASRKNAGKGSVTNGNLNSRIDCHLPSAIKPPEFVFHIGFFRSSLDTVKNLDLGSFDRFVYSHERNLPLPISDLKIS